MESATARAPSRTAPCARRALAAAAVLAGAAIGAAPVRAAAVHHRLSVRIAPERHEIEVRDRITLAGIAPSGDGAFRFVLHAGLAPKVVAPGWSLVRVPGEATASFAGINATTETVARNVPLEGWRLIPQGDAPEGAGAAPEVELTYGGAIHHPIEAPAEEYQRGFPETPGTIEERGVLLSGTTFWTPAFGDGLVTFDIEVAGLAPPWDVVSQGRRLRHEADASGRRTTAWSCPHPTEEIYLAAGPWTEYAGRAGAVELLAFLRDPDPALASRYLEAGRRYLEMYARVLPPYPYASFALVENFWDTGYGMPGFTLLGPKVIRFPWILTSSYPHEVLHNWWGNSVFVEMSGGNWCEGLTAYMADHLLDEQKGEGAAHRRAALRKYADFAREGRDFPLSRFRSRRSAATEAVGYGKSLMVFHMLRREAGDESFLRALSLFAERHRFARASFADLAAAFTETSGRDWGPFLRAWTERAGAPRIEIAEASAAPPGGASGAWRVALRLRQTQDEAPFPAVVPVAVTVEGRADPFWTEVAMEGREAAASIEVPGRPLRLDVDPAFDVMRRLDPLEVPPALSALFGEDDPAFVLPASTPPEEQAAWRDLAAAWSQNGSPRIVLDSEPGGLPPGGVWILGRGNRLAPSVAALLADQGVAVDADGLVVGAERHAREGRSVVLVTRRGDDPRAGLAWVAADPSAAIPGLARKLPHYTRYSYLVFRGEEPENVAKGMWEPASSPLVRNLGGGALPPLRPAARRPLADLPAAFDAAALRRGVEALASEEMEGRSPGSAGIEKAAAWVESRMREIGLEPGGDSGFRQSWTWEGGDPPRRVPLANVVGRIAGSDPSLAEHPVLLLAHLDHLGTGGPGVRAGNEGKLHPGADDNASGVAALLEVARALASAGRPARPIVVAAVTAEEQGLVGSRRLLAGLAPDRLPFACVNLDTVGRLRDGKLHVLDAGSAREWRHIFMGVQATTGIPVAVATEPLAGSDQAACLERGVPAVQIFTGANADYHRPTDTADKIDAEGMARVAEVVHKAAAYLAGRAEPLTVSLPAAAAAPAAGPPAAGGATPRSERRAALGTVPDFSYEGPGVRVQEVLPGSPAEAAGIRPGDVILSLDGTPITGLRAYSDLLKARKPGDAVEVVVRKDGEKTRLRVVLAAR
jgi:hypothetical protein